MCSVLLLFLLCLTSRAGASEDFWPEKYEDQRNCAREREMRELGPERCVSRPSTVEWVAQWLDCKTQLETKLLTKCGPGNVGQGRTINTERSDWLVHLHVEDCSEELLRQQSYAIKNKGAYKRTFPCIEASCRRIQSTLLRGILLASCWILMA